MLIVLVAFASGVTAEVFATSSASGADASGYLSQAELWAAGKLAWVDVLGMTLAGLDHGFVTTPLGWRPLSPGVQVPSYAPGLPLLMAIPQRMLGAIGALLVIPVCAAVAVWSVGAVARVIAGGAAGLFAAVAIAVAPVFLFQSVQPMSDVPVTAAWMLCWWLILRGLGIGAGFACAVAVLIRPNLAPLATIPLWYAFSTSRREALRFAGPVVLAAVGLALLQWMWYGSPLRSGYGGAGELFARSNIVPNLSRYAGWLLDTSPAMLTAICGAFVLRHRRDAKALGVFALLVVAAYLAYAVFDDWSYLRFLLPALAVGAVFVSVCLKGLTSLAPVSLRPIVFVFLVLPLAAHGIFEARARDTFTLADQQRRVERTALALTARMSPTDVIVSGEQSGSMRYYTKREIVRWDELRPEQWDALFSELSKEGRRSWIVLDAFEEPLFRTKFGAKPDGALDWPPAIEAGDTHRTRAWSVTDRARFVAGEEIETARLR